MFKLEGSLEVQCAHFTDERSEPKELTDLPDLWHNQSHSCFMGHLVYSINTDIIITVCHAAHFDFHTESLKQPYKSGSIILPVYR